MHHNSLWLTTTVVQAASILVLLLLRSAVAQDDEDTSDKPEDVDGRYGYPGAMYGYQPSYGGYAQEPNHFSGLSNHKGWKFLNPNVCGLSMADRIIGGTNATLGQYPWLTRIYYTSVSSPRESGFKCGGTLISPKYVVTAAHCVIGIPEDLTLSGLRLGEHFTFSEIDCVNGVCAAPVQDFAPVQILVHKLYNNPTKFQNDVCLIKLDREAVLNGWVMPICLPGGDQLRRDYTGSYCEVAGWGVTDSAHLNDPSSYLLTVKLPVIQLDNCRNAFRSQTMVTDTQVCIGGIVGKDSCAGDSGGPMMIPESVGGLPPRYYLQGIVSFGPKRCGKTPTPAVYTKVASFVYWILENLEP